MPIEQIILPSCRLKQFLLDMIIITFRPLCGQESTFTYVFFLIKGKKTALCLSTTGINRQPFQRHCL